MIKFYEAFAEADDLTFIMKMEDTDTGIKKSVVGFYHGEPNAELTKIYTGSLTAEYESMKVSDIMGEDND